LPIPGRAPPLAARAGSAPAGRIISNGALTSLVTAAGTGFTSFGWRRVTGWRPDAVELELVRGRFAAEHRRSDVVRRKHELDLAARDRPSAVADELEVEAQRGAARPGLRADARARSGRRIRRPPLEPARARTPEDDVVGDGALPRPAGPPAG
jgi:hypothetical protein